MTDILQKEASKVNKAIKVIGGTVSHGDSSISYSRRDSRKLYDKNAVARAAINNKNTTVIGAGLKLQSCIDNTLLGLPEEKVTKLQTLIEHRHRLWAKNKFIDIDGNCNFYQLQDLVKRGEQIEGDSFALLPLLFDKHLENPLKIKLYSAGQISNPNFEPNSDKLVDGIEFDGNGRPCAIHIANYDGIGYPVDWKRVPFFGDKTNRRNVIHIFKPDFAGQKRGLPALFPIIQTIAKIGEFTEASIKRAVVSALYTVFITETDESEEEADHDIDLEQDEELEKDENGDPVEEIQEIEMGPGAVHKLPPGHNIELAEPKNPAPDFQKFIDALCQQIGAALEIPREILMKEFNKSYSASRAALLEYWRVIERDRSWFATSFCQPVFEEWLAIEVTLGFIDLPGFFENPTVRAAYCNAKWNGSAMGQINPYVETKAIAERLRLLLTSLEEEKTRLDGGDIEDTLNRIQIELNKTSKLKETVNE